MILDGVFPQKKLFILTCNELWKLNKNLKNRPGRIFYMLEYTGLDEAFVREYLADNLNDKTQTEKFVRTAMNLFETFNFDMMMAMVQEMNRYNESIGDVLKYINAKPSSASNISYDVTISKNGVNIKSFSPKIATFDIWDPDRTRTIYLQNSRDGGVNKLPVAYDEDEENVSNNSFELIAKSLVAMDIANGVYAYAIEGYIITLTKIKAHQTFTYMNALGF